MFGHLCVCSFCNVTCAIMTNKFNTMIMRWFLWLKENSAAKYPIFTTYGLGMIGKDRKHCVRIKRHQSTSQINFGVQQLLRFSSICAIYHYLFCINSLHVRIVYKMSDQHYKDRSRKGEITQSDPSFDANLYGFSTCKEVLRDI